jgi:hypothetical protein
VREHDWDRQAGGRMNRLSSKVKKEFQRRLCLSAHSNSHISNLQPIGTAVTVPIII